MPRGAANGSLVVYRVKQRGRGLCLGTSLSPEGSNQRVEANLVAQVCLEGNTDE